MLYFLNPKGIKGLFINPRWRQNKGYEWKNENSIYKVKASTLSFLSCIFEMLLSQRLRLYKFCLFSLSETYNPPIVDRLNGMITHKVISEDLQVFRWERNQCQSHLVLGLTHQKGSDRSATHYKDPGGVLPIMAYMGRLCPKGVPFSGFRGRDFTSWNIQKSREICHLGLWQGSKGLADEFYGFTKSRKCSILWLFPVKKTVHLKQFKGMESSKQGM